MFYYASILGPLTCTYPFHSSPFTIRPYFFLKMINLQIPDKVLEHRPRERTSIRNGESSSPSSSSSSPDSRPSDDAESGNYIIHDSPSHKGQRQIGRPAPRPRRLSMYEDGDAVMDPESGSNLKNHRSTVSTISPR
jgi:hypothetical protein